MVERVPELALDQRQRDPLVQQLDGVRMPELMGRKPAPYASLNGKVAQLRTHCGGAPRAAAGRPVDYAEQRTDRQLEAVSEPGVDRRPPPGVHADFAPAVVLTVPDQNRAATSVKVGLGQRQRLVDP